MEQGVNMTANLDNVISRLPLLKNVSKRKVMPGEGVFNNLEDQEMDVSNVSNQRPPPYKNEPQSDTGGQLTSQGYDVRANDVESPEAPQSDENENPFYRFGKYIKNYMNESYKPSLGPEFSQNFPDVSNRIQTQKENITPEAKPESVNNYYMHAGYNKNNPQKKEEPGVVSSFINEVKNYVPNYFSKDIKELNKGFGFTAPEEGAKESTPFQPSEYNGAGASQEILNDPILQQEFKKYTGVDYQPQLASQVSEYENAMQGVEEFFKGNNVQLDEQANAISQRILNGQVTDNDKYYIGMALLMPLIVGGIFGKEAGFGALAGAGGAVSDILKGRESNLRKDEEALLGLRKEQAGNQEKLANMHLEKAKLEPTLRKNLPSQPYEHLIGGDYITDPETGENLHLLAPGFAAPEKYLNNPKALERMQKSAEQLSSTKTYVQQLNKITSEVSDVLSQLKDKPFWKKAHIPSITTVLPGSLSTLSDDVMYKGNKVASGPLIESLLANLSTKYAQAESLGQLDSAAQKVMRDIVSNPTKTLLTLNDVKNQILNVRKFAQDELLNMTKNKGFSPAFISQEMERENAPLSNKMNKKEDKKISENAKIEPER